MKKVRISAHIAEKKKKQMKIETDFIRLDSALKYADIAVTGGHAKILIGDGEIKINGEPCTMRGKKLRKGDSFEYDGFIYEIV